jgi:hypothetical protein
VGEPVQFSLYQRQKLFQCSLITIAPVNQQAGDFIIGGGHKALTAAGRYCEAPFGVMIRPDDGISSTFNDSP